MEEKNSAETEGKDMDVRSEKVRKLIEARAPLMVRWGTLVIFLVVVALLAAVSQLPYPYSEGESILSHIFMGK
ncbi:MAG: hypothetical protein HDS62_05075 [Bacteroidales bacterium]|nr:hypothetical protein [Bacteroidales bacterium]